MAVLTKTRLAAYCAGGSLSRNIEYEVDTRTQAQIDNNDPEIMETRFKVVMSVSSEVLWDDGSIDPQRKAEQINLLDPDDDTKDYRLSMWDIPTIARSLAQAALDADDLIKTTKGKGSPNHGKATTVIV